MVCPIHARATGSLLFVLIRLVTCQTRFAGGRYSEDHETRLLLGEGQLLPGAEDDGHKRDSPKI